MKFFIFSLNGGMRMFQLLNQPFDGALGTILKEKLIEGKYKHFIIVSAFAKNSGVLRLKDSLQTFRNQGGTVDAFIGLDAHGTSYEAVLNLLSCTDNLYIVHDLNPSVTFHSKIYYLTDSNNQTWMAVGSNNFTGGGLWTNFESAVIINGNEKTIKDLKSLQSDFIKFVDKYKDCSCNLSIKINNANDLNKLYEAGLLYEEIRLQIEAAKERQKNKRSKEQTISQLFGTNGRVSLPRLKSNVKSKKVVIKNTNNESIIAAEPIVLSDASEKMWFETKKMTGGSRNILDLSMLGKIDKGTGDETRYKTNKESFVLGSVVFFDVDPNDNSREKDITINYKAKDYLGCTIKMHQSGRNPNGSWRIQLKGKTASGEILTTAGGENWLIQKIIVLEKIRTDYYVMSVLSESMIENLKNQSVFVAINGGKPNAKQYGLLDI